jgi:hypothetical protein
LQRGEQMLEIRRSFDHERVSLKLKAKLNPLNKALNQTLKPAIRPSFDEGCVRLEAKAKIRKYECGNAFFHRTTTYSPKKTKIN